jgi:hypothetical protein
MFFVLLLNFLTSETPPDFQVKSSLPLLLEDPVRRRYKVLLASSFILTSSLYLLVDSAFHIQSAVTESWLAHR